MKLFLTVSLLTTSSALFAGFGFSVNADIELQIWNIAEIDIDDRGLHLNLGPLDDGDPAGGVHLEDPRSLPAIEGWILRIEDRNTGDHVFLTVQGAYFGIHRTLSQPYIAIQTTYNNNHDLLVLYRYKDSSTGPATHSVVNFAGGPEFLASALAWMAPKSRQLAPAAFYQSAATAMVIEDYTLIEHSEAPNCLQYMVDAGAAALRFMAEEGDPQELATRLIELRSATDDHLLHTNNCTVGPPRP